VKLPKRIPYAVSGDYVLPFVANPDSLSIRGLSDDSLAALISVAGSLTLLKCYSVGIRIRLDWVSSPPCITVQAGGFLPSITFKLLARFEESWWCSG